jgi:hypothetical protein
MPQGVSVREELIVVAKLDVTLDVGDAHELAEQAGRKLAATTQEVVAEGRKRLGRRAKKRARKLEQRVTEAAKRLPVDTPVDRRRRRTVGRAALIVRVVLATAVLAAVYAAWRARNQPMGTAEDGSAPDAFGAAMDASDDGEQASATTHSEG